MITEGDMETITCEAIGYPPATLEWSMSDGALSDRVSVSNSFLIGFGVGLNLTITNASREDTGVYICSANNSIGSDNESISVTVQCKCSFTLQGDSIDLFLLQFNQLFYQKSEI